MLGRPLISGFWSDGAYRPDLVLGDTALRAGRQGAGAVDSSGSVTFVGLTAACTAWVQQARRAYWSVEPGGWQPVDAWCAQKPNAA